MRIHDRFAVHRSGAGFVAALVMVTTIMPSVPVPAAEIAGHGASAKAPADAKVALAQELLGLSNMSPVLAGWRETLAQSSDFGQYGLGKETQARLMSCWRRAVLKSFDIKAAEQKLAALYAERFKMSELKDLIALRHTPVGERISLSERSFHARTSDTQRSMAWMIDAAARLEQDRDRKALIEAIAELGGGTKALTDALINISVSASIGAEAIKPAGQPRHSPAEIAAIVEQHRQQMWQHLDAVVVTQHEMLYEQLSLTDLGTLKAFMASELGRRHTEVSLDAFNQLMRDEALAIGAQFATEWQSQDL